ncbi:MAG TPA: M48 family metalloprotease [Pyrinomonadaceae bacterium]|nr:M48 family metalloprotease [Pyrinomonadaceae bacterium]
MKVKTTMIHFLAGIVFLALMMPTFALAQKKTDEEKKAEKQNQKDEKRVEKNVRKYEETLTKAFDKYNKDFEFRDEVDYEFRNVQREHARVAFEVNTLDTNDYLTTNSGDKLPRNNDTLYDNLTAQDFVNRVGQSLVPANSEKRYGFKITVNPMPDARSLSTGTIYVSTGLLSLIDNEAQLAYILSHEIAHVERDHWKEDVMVAKWIEDATEKQERRGSIFGAIAGGVIGGVLGGGIGDLAIFGASIGKSVAKLIDRKAFEWALAQEDEADKLALDYMLKRNYDVKEAQNFYDTLKVVAIEDPRIELDKFADRKRSEERRKTVDAWVKNADSSALARTTLGATNLRGKSLSLDRNTTVTTNRLSKNQEKMADELKMKIQNGEIMAGDGEFENIMAILKRDNGIVAFYYDMYKLSARNLNQSLAIRSDDALTYFYYGRVLKLTARKSGERELALQMFGKAIEFDKRNANPQSRLYYALTQMNGRSTNNITEIVKTLKEYVALYQQLNAGALPPNMSSIYDFMQEAGELNWSASPVLNVKTVTTTTTAKP